MNKNIKTETMKMKYTKTMVPVLAALALAAGCSSEKQETQTTSEVEEKVVQASETPKESAVVAEDAGASDPVSTVTGMLGSFTQGGDSMDDLLGSIDVSDLVETQTGKLKDAFSSASGTVKESADSAISGLEGGKYESALSSLKSLLSDDSEATADQKSSVSETVSAFASKAKEVVVDQVSDILTQLSASNPDAKASFGSAVSSLQSSDYAGAFAGLKDAASKIEFTDEQKQMFDGALAKVQSLIGEDTMSELSNKATEAISGFSDKLKFGQ